MHLLCDCYTICYEICFVKGFNMYYVDEGIRYYVTHTNMDSSHLVHLGGKLINIAEYLNYNCLIYLKIYCEYV